MERKSGGGRGGDGGMVDNPNEILVFGYACKLFRDDEKASWIDDELHLIPWMGDSSVSIDRYDGRGTLMDLTGGGDEPKPMEGIRLNKPSELEEMLEEERYKDCKVGEDLAGNEQEDEYQKFQTDVGQSSYAAIGYSYEQPENETAENIEAKVEDCRPYLKPKGLNIPGYIVVPPTMKLHSIIEKTAKFIASHGSQMEIILKTKQSGNVLFNFLDYEDVLNPYFKFLVQAIRDNTYKPDENQETAPEESLNTGGENGDESDEDEDYLHPSLFRSAQPVDRNFQLPIHFKSNGNSTYSLLVSKIKGTTGVESTNAQPNTTTPSTGNVYNNNECVQQAAGNTYYSSSGHVYSMDASGNPFCDDNASNQIPNPSDQLVIEKMASYVVKNGPAFEELAKARGDPRFVFLNPTHEFYWYYLNCKEKYISESAAVVANRQFQSYSGDKSPTTQSNPSSLVSAVATKPDVGVKRINLQSIELPLSASGIPIANLESISNRPTSIPPEVASRIELIKKKNSLFAKKETSPPKIQFASSIGKGLGLASSSSSDSTLQNAESTQFVAIPSFSTTKGCENGASDMIAITEYPSLTSVSPEKKSKRDRVTNEEEEDRLRKKIRRQKAALFLQKINSKPSSGAAVLKSEFSSNSNIDTATEEGNPTLNLSDEQKILSIDYSLITDKSSRRRKSSKSSKKKRARSTSRSVSPIYRRSRSRSTYSSESSDSHAYRKSRRSKKKSSKKKKKKHSTDRSRSNSKSHKRSKKQKR